MRTRLQIRPRRRRAGVSLVELVLLIASVTVILSACGIFIHLLLKLDQAGRRNMSETGTVSRLARQFRTDVRSATVARVIEPDADKTGRLELSTEGKPTVTYRVEDGTLLRTEADGAKVFRREAYAVESLTPPIFGREGDGRLVMTLPRRGDASGPLLRHGYRVEALLGKDHPVKAGAQ